MSEPAATIMTVKTVGWTIGIALLLVVLLSAVATVLYGISLGLVETYSPD
ncbi:MAG: hypothetical protein ACJ72M_01530 [Propionibacteriaceae bacterium]